MSESLNRRAALGALAGVPALAILPASAIASHALPTGADAELFELLAEWREADARANAADKRVWEADDGADIARPDVVIKTAEDAELFVTDEEIGEHYRRPKSFAAIEGTISIVMGHFFTPAPIVAMIKRFEEIHAAHCAHQAAVDAAREAAGYPELVRLQEEARAEERSLCHEVAVTPARTVRGLLAKLSAVADIFGHEDLELDTAFKDGENVSLEDAALTILRDCARMEAQSC
jgi:hypothetical protein